MRPVDDTATLVPLVLAVKLDRISRLERADATCEIDIVRDQHRLPGRQPNDKALMATAFVVVREHFGDAATALNLNVATVILERDCQGAVGTRGSGAAAVGSGAVIVMLSRKKPTLRSEIYGREGNRYGNDPFHCPTQ
jgi:hypothetical protein